MDRNSPNSVYARMCPDIQSSMQAFFKQLENDLHGFFRSLRLNIKASSPQASTSVQVQDDMNSSVSLFTPEEIINIFMLPDVRNRMDHTSWRFLLVYFNMKKQYYEDLEEGIIIPDDPDVTCKAHVIDLINHQLFPSDVKEIVDAFLEASSLN